VKLFYFLSALISLTPFEKGMDNPALFYTSQTFFKTPVLIAFSQHYHISPQ